MLGEGWEARGRRHHRLVGQFRGVVLPEPERAAESLVEISLHTSLEPAEPKRKGKGTKRFRAGRPSVRPLARAAADW